jgi:NhaP-type Na+/H+ or K+/H+ antiporter
MENITLVIAILALFIYGYALISRRITTTIITAPMIFVTFGLVISTFAVNVLDLSVNNEIISIVGEMTLVLVLFSDASRIKLGNLRHEHIIPTRLLVIGLPLTILLGALIAVWLVGILTFWEAAVLAAILAPTDAALGQAVVTNKRVPVRIRQALNVESGLNDGIALPFLLLFLTAADATQTIDSAAYWVRFAIMQLTLGPLIGIGIGYLGGQVLRFAVKRGWADGVFEKLGAVAIAYVAYAIADLIGGNGFIAAFVAGLVIGNTARDVCGRVHEFAEAEGQLLTLITFVVFGAVMVQPMVAEFRPIYLIYAVLSLTVIRMLPVAIALKSLNLKRNTQLFLGWFGPRGIASVIYALLLFEYSGIVNGDIIFSIVVVTVLLSIFAHGITAVPFANRYGGHMEEMLTSDDLILEAEPVPEMPLRFDQKRTQYGGSAGPS